MIARTETSASSAILVFVVTRPYQSDKLPRQTSDVGNGNSKASNVSTVVLTATVGIAVVTTITDMHILHGDHGCGETR